MASAQDVASQQPTLGTVSQPHHHDGDDGNDDTNQKYKYESIQSPSHIRILELKPGSHEAPLRCSLVQVGLEEKPLLEALSYAWGDASDREVIECDGKEINITRSLHEALGALRHPDDSRRLWADAICINQEDLSERGSQVQLMCKIYSEASRVLLWLGKYDQRVIDTAFRFFELFRSNEQMEQWHRNRELLRLQGTRFQFDRDTEDAIVTLITRPVFRRGWIIQEFALAPSIQMCWGSATLDYFIFSAACQVLLEDLQEIVNKHGAGPAYYGLLMMRSIRAQQQSGSVIDPMWLISLIDKHLFSDERDRVYGILALRMPANKQRPDQRFVRVDYTITKWDAFRSFTEACLVREGSLTTLLYDPHRGRRDTITFEGQPSWVGDWSKPGLFWRNLHERPFSQYSCGDEKSRIKQVDQQRISIDGISIARVENILGVCYDKEPQTRLRYISTLFDAACVAETASALFFDYRCIEKNAHNLKEFGQALQSACREYLELDLTKNPLSHYFNWKSRADWFGVMCQNTLQHADFFCSSQGKLGLGPKHMQEGDTIVILFGSQDPNLSFILRPFGESWKLVGPCYMYDLKTGFAIEKWRLSGKPSETFIIC